MNGIDQPGRMGLDRKETVSLLSRHGIRPNRKLGQNFLVDPVAAGRIAELSEAGRADPVIEIGPGIGALTTRLADIAGRVTAYEIDRGLIPLLDETLGGHENVTVIRADFMDVDPDALLVAQTPHGEAGAVRVAANVPYYITTPILRKILTDIPSCQTLVLMVQREAADRLLAKPGSKAYGPVAVFLSALFETRSMFRLTPGAFYPRPGVDSSVVRAKLRGSLGLPETFSRAGFIGTVDAAFSHRRKQLVNSMKSSGRYSVEQMKALPGILADIGLDEGCRAEEVAADTYLQLHSRLVSHT